LRPENWFRANIWMAKHDVDGVLYFINLIFASGLKLFFNISTGTNDSLVVRRDNYRF